MGILIFANGNFAVNSQIKDVIEKAETIIAVDGGANHCESLGIKPSILIGDCDSIEKQLVEQYINENIPISRFPKQKDATDLELALEYTMNLKEGCLEVDILGGLGGRWDMSLANIQLAAQDKFSSLNITLHDAKCQLRILHPGRYSFAAAEDQRISILPLSSSVAGVTLHGMMYPLSNNTIRFGSTLGISNIAIDQQPCIEHNSGILLCIFQDD